MTWRTAVVSFIDPSTDRVRDAKPPKKKKRGSLATLAPLLDQNLNDRCDAKKADSDVDLDVNSQPKVLHFEKTFGSAMARPV
jgi:hypothetical protein